MSKNVKRATLVLALTPILAAPATVALAGATAPTVTVPTVTASTTAAPAVTPVQHTAASARSATTSTTSTTTTTTTTSAPPASASAVAARVDGVIAIGDTSASASSTGGKAHAHALDVLGTKVSGGDVTSGSDHGALFATPDNPLGDLELAPWSGSVAHPGGGTQTQAEAALAHAGLLGELQLWLLHSQSSASWTDAASQGDAQSDGAEVSAGGQLDVKVLHAETHSSGKQSSAILVINGQGILTDQQTGGACKLDADPLVSLLCLQAAGGKGAGGTTTSAADVLTESSGVGLPGGDVSGVTSGGGRVAVPHGPTTSSSGASHTPSGPLPSTNGSSSVGDRTPSASRLPFTGGETGLLAAYGAALLALGAGITAAARRRRHVPAV